MDPLKLLKLWLSKYILLSILFFTFIFHCFQFLPSYTVLCAEWSYGSSVWLCHNIVINHSILSILFSLSLSLSLSLLKLSFCFFVNYLVLFLWCRGSVTVTLVNWHSSSIGWIYLWSIKFNPLSSIYGLWIEDNVQLLRWYCNKLFY